MLGLKTSDFELIELATLYKQPTWSVESFALGDVINLAQNSHQNSAVWKEDKTLNILSWKHHIRAVLPYDRMVLGLLELFEPSFQKAVVRTTRKRSDFVTCA